MLLIECQRNVGKYTKYTKKSLLFTLREKKTQNQQQPLLRVMKELCPSSSYLRLGISREAPLLKRQSFGRHSDAKAANGKVSTNTAEQFIRTWKTTIFIFKTVKV